MFHHDRFFKQTVHLVHCQAIKYVKKVNMSEEFVT